MNRTDFQEVIDTLDIAPENCPRCHHALTLSAPMHIINRNYTEVSIRCDCGFSGQHRATYEQALLSYNRLAREVAIEQ